MEKITNEALTKLFVEFNSSVEKLNALSKTSKRDFLNNYEKVDTAKYNFIIAIETMIDICSHIIAEKNLGAPEEYAEVFRIMGEEEIFPENYIKKLIEMTKFRNLLVHVYWKVQDEKIHEYLQNNLEDFDIFKNHIKVYLNSN